MVNRDRQECLSYCDPMKNQIRAKTFVGWELIVGLLIFTVMTLIVGQLGEEIANGEPLTLTDLEFTGWLQTHRTQPLTTALRLATELGSTWMAIATAGIFGLYLLWRKRIYWLVVVWLSVFGGMGLNRLLKYAFQRPRPSFDDPILSLTGHSFPSGHTMAATVLYSVLAAYLVSHSERFATRAFAVLSACVLIGIVGFSRIYLGAHYLTDVLGALAEGLAWLSLCLSIIYSVWRQRCAS